MIGTVKKATATDTTSPRRTEARIVLEHLFEKNMEGTMGMGAKEIRSEFGEFKQIYDESVKNTNALETEITGLEGELETEKISVARDHEEKVLFLLNKLQQNSVGNDEINRIHEAEINQFSRLHEDPAGQQGPGVEIE